ncbi:MAG: LamG-like jellyroll fold domain-containing protein [Flavobacteriales bacterium]
MKTLYALLAFLAPLALLADPGDTTIVQTYTFEAQNNPDANYDSPGRRTFDFPEDDGTSYQKILMYYTLKCFEDGTAGGLGFDCGEWDYTTHTFLYEHTGELDSSAQSHPLFLVNNVEFDSTLLSSTPGFSFYMQDFLETRIDSVIQETEFQVNTEFSESLSFENSSAGRFQIYYSPSELIDAEIAGVVQKLALKFEGSSTLSNFRIRLSELDDAPTEMVNENLEQYFFNPNFGLGEGDQTDVLLDQEYEWDLESGLLIDVSFDNCTSSFSVLGGSGSSYGLNNVSDKYIEFNGGDQVTIPEEIFEALDDKITIGYWLNGSSEFQPENSSTFEGIDASNQRVLNVHNPWSNGQVYWDAGQDNGYDRINAQAVESQYSGQWNHWAFTKNTTTGIMKIFLNGEEWLSGTNKDNSMVGITKFIIGSSASGTNFYRGAMDDFFILNEELTAEEIQLYMSQDYSETLPYAEELKGYFTFDQDYGEALNNEVSDYNGYLLGNAALKLHEGQNPAVSSTTYELKPWLSLYNGEYEFIEVTQSFMVEEVFTPYSVVEYEVNGNELEIVNYQALYPEYYLVNYDALGNAVDSILNVEVTSEFFSNETLNYYAPPFEVVNRIELGRFITPYGIGLDLEEGWTWVYEVTDYEPLLHGEVELEAGNWQELLDLKFAFIEGTPPRDVMRVENIWAGNWQLSTWQETVQEQSIEVQEGEEMFKVRATTSGHWFGQGNNCAEFCQNMHSLDVNGSTQHSWEMIQECADNPLYPQGGTWIYDRAGWCPGAPVTTRELEITDAVNGEDFTVDYNIEYDPYGNYWLMGQLISYGAPNYQSDVEISEILAPSEMKIHSRMNPICESPVVRIRNNGTETLTSCTFTVNVGGQESIHEWTGELEFMQSEDVTLDVSSFLLLSGEEGEVQNFEVMLISTGGTADQNMSNNTAKSTFVIPPVYHYDDYDDNRIIVEVNTNNAPWEMEATLYTLGGGVMWQSNYTEANTLYRDTLVLNSGCYQIHFTDSDDDGISFFANNDGNGNMRFRKVQGFYFETFEDNFGKELIHNFSFETDLFSGIDEEVVKDIEVFPNPSSDIFYLKGINLRGNAHYSVVNSSGQEVLSKSHFIANSSDRIEVDLSGFSAGVYSISVKISGKTHQKRVVRL